MTEKGIGLIIYSSVAIYGTKVIIIIEKQRKKYLVSKKSYFYNSRCRL